MFLQQMVTLFSVDYFQSIRLVQTKNSVVCLMKILAISTWKPCCTPST